MSISAFCSAEKIYIYKEDDDEKRWGLCILRLLCLSLKNLMRERWTSFCFLAAWWDDEYKKATTTEDSLTAPSFRVLYETLNTRGKKKIESERERAKRKDQNAREFFPFSQKKARRKKGTRLALFFLFFLSSVSLKEQQKRRDFETTKREKRVIRWCSFCPAAMVALFHPRRRVLFYHHQWEEWEEERVRVKIIRIPNRRIVGKSDDETTIVCAPKTTPLLRILLLY